MKSEARPEPEGSLSKPHNQLWRVVLSKKHRFHFQRQDGTTQRINGPLWDAPNTATSAKTTSSALRTITRDPDVNARALAKDGLSTD
jgi:hypothetical protein